MIKKIVLSLIAILGISFAAMAQKQVTGTVVDQSGAPVPGASVMVQGTNVGAVTDLDGHFTIKATDKDVLAFSFFGMKDVSVAVGSQSVINVTLAEDALKLDEVVVTAMGISRAEKTLGYSATTVKSDDIVSARTTNVANALSGKVAGVQVQATSTDPGAASNIIIRGFSSVKGSNQPLYVVDGVPLQNINLNTQEKSTALAGIANINSEDIASMTILKGAAATALYGSRAANGVIVITTKEGRKGATRDFTIDYSGGIQLRQVSTLPIMQNDYGQGWNGTQTYIENGSWGPKLDGSRQVFGPVWNHQQLIQDYDAKVKNIQEFFEIGVSQNHNVALSGASDDNKMTYYLSYGYSGDDGIMPDDHDKFKRNTIAYRGTFKAAEWLKLSSSINFARTSTDLVGTYQGTSVIDGLYEFPRNVSLIDLKDLSSAFHTPEAYFTPYGITNPYWALANNYNHNDAKQIYGKVQVDIIPTKHLTLTYRMGYDYSDFDTKVGYPQIALDDALINDDKGYAPSNMNQAGFVATNYGRYHETNNDFLATYTNKFLGDKLDLTAIAGVNINERGNTVSSGETDDLTFNTGYWQLSNGATKTTIAESQSLRRLVGAFADVTLGWNNEVYVDVTARNDWSSTLPIDANNYFYSGATLSWIFSNRLPANDILTFGKVRLAYGKTGNDASPYQTSVSYTQAYSNGYYYSSIIDFPHHGVNSFISAASKGSGSLRPEMTTEFEVGLNLQFFNGRLGLDAAYYDRTTSDQIFSLPTDPATGFNSMVTNFGDVTNKGIELLINTVPVQTKDFRWSLDFNFAKNNNLVKTLPDGLEGGKSVIDSFSAGSDAVYVYAEVGKPMGEFYTYLPQYTEKGQLIVGEDGLPLIGTDVVDTGKNFQNDWVGGISTELTWKNFSLSAVLDIRKGGYMFSRTKNLMEFTGNGIATIYNDRRPFVIPNSVYEDGSENITPIYLYNSSYQDYFDATGAGLGGEFYMIDRSFAKLRNISLTWNLPKKWLQATTLSAASISAFCNNAFIWTAADNYYIDPEATSFADGGDLAAQFGELYSNPTCRIWGMNVSIKF